LATLAFETGLRKTELSNIKLADIDMDNHTLQVLGKRKKYRNPVFSKRSGELIKLWLQKEYDNKTEKEKWIHKKGYALVKGKTETHKVDRSEYLFDLLPEGIYQALSSVGQRLGIKTNPHSFRRGLTVSLLEAGKTLEDVKNIMGHENIKTTLIYAGEYDERKSQKNYESPLAGMDNLFNNIGNAITNAVKDYKVGGLATR